MIKINGFKVLFMSALLTLGFSTAAHAATYKVLQGDSLYSIGKLFNNSVSSIINSNNLSGSAIYPGQKINVSCTTYTVKTGDTLYAVAKQYGVSIDALKRASYEWDNILYVGQILNIPAATTQTTGQAPTIASQSVIPYTANDLDLLARLIRAEAENQPYTAKVAVGAVVVNRVQSSVFPNSISEVIYQRINGYYQFTPVLNGYINKTATQEDINAAYAALHGSDPTNGALFYFDDSTTNQWLWSKTVALRVGNMVFSY